MKSVQMAVNPTMLDKRHWPIPESQNKDGILIILLCTSSSASL